MSTRELPRAAICQEAQLEPSVVQLSKQCSELAAGIENLHQTVLGHDRLITVQRAAEQAGIGEETIRNWCRDHGIGYFDHRSRRYLVDPAKLSALLLARRGRSPYGLCAG